MKQFLFFVMLALIVTVAITPGIAQAKTFDNGEYTFTYPNGCKIEKKDNRFSTADASLECKGDAGFLFESGADTSNALSDLTDDELISDLESTMGEIHFGSDVIQRSSDVDAKQYTINNQSAPYIVGNYDQEFSNAFGLTKTEEWGLMIMVIKVGDDKLLVQYRNNEEDFDKQLPMAEKIFASVHGLKADLYPDDEGYTSSSSSTESSLPNCDDVQAGTAKDLCEKLLDLRDKLQN